MWVCTHLSTHYTVLTSLKPGHTLAKEKYESWCACVGEGTFVQCCTAVYIQIAGVSTQGGERSGNSTNVTRKLLRGKDTNVFYSFCRQNKSACVTWEESLQNQGASHYRRTYTLSSCRNHTTRPKLHYIASFSIHTFQSEPLHLIESDTCDTSRQVLSW